MRSSFILRSRIIIVAFAIVAVFLLLRLYIVQVVNAESYRNRAENQYVSPALSGEDRGDIFFTTKDGRESYAATMDSGFRVAIKPDRIEDADELFTLLSGILEIDKERFFASAAKKDDPYEEVAFRVDKDTANAIAKLNREEIVLASERWRIYPADSQAAHVLGFVGFEGNARRGQYGLERQWESTLALDESSLYVNFFAEIFANIRSFAANGSPNGQGDLVTSIEPSVQQKLESVLAGVESDYSGKQIGGIVMDPQTGAIIAMAVRPTFNPNTFNEEKGTSVFANSLVESVFEMGSIMKPLTVAAGLDSGAITPETTYRDLGSVEKSGQRISNFDGKARGRVNMQEVLNQSLNTGAVFIVDEMGKEAFARYVKAFGLGERTQVDLPNEAKGLIQALDSGIDLDYASASFGQGIATTPIAMTRALAALANGGELVNPHVVEKVRYQSGLVNEPWQRQSRRVISPETSETITRMLVRVYDEALLGGVLKKDRHSLAAKTGTAQIARQDGDGYYDDRIFHSFFGYFPAYDARFIIFLYVLEPQGVSYASQTLSRPFDDLAQFIINTYDIPPDR